MPGRSPRETKHPQLPLPLPRQTGGHRGLPVNRRVPTRGTPSHIAAPSRPSAAGRPSPSPRLPRQPGPQRAAPRGDRSSSPGSYLSVATAPPRVSWLQRLIAWFSRRPTATVAANSAQVTPPSVVKRPEQQPQRKTSDVSDSRGTKRVRRFPSDLRFQLNTRGWWTSSLRGARKGDEVSAARPPYTEVQLEEAFQTRIAPEDQKAHLQTIVDERKAGQEPKRRRDIAMGIIFKTFPFIKMFMNYDIKEDGPYDLISGVSVGLFLIPQSMAYSLLANVRPQYGFYSAFLSMLIYFFIGSAAHVNMTNQGAVSLLVGEAVRAGVEQVYPNEAGLCVEFESSASAHSNFSAATLKLTTASPLVTTTRKINATLNSTVSKPCIDRDDANALVALTITMIAGAVQLLGGFLRLGFLTIYLSDPINKAFTCGAAMHIVSGQLGNILGAPVPTFSGNGKFFLYFVEAFKQIAALNVNLATILIFFSSFAVLLAVKIVNEKFIKKIRFPIPIDIIVLVVSLLLSKFLHWHDLWRIADVGEIKKGFETPRAPIPEHFTSGSGIIVNGIVLGVIAYALSISLAKTFALRNGYEVDPNQEMIAYGAANFGGCWFGTFVSASAIACSSLHESLKGKTLVYSLYAIVITFLAIMVFAPEFAPVPKCVLSAIIIVNLKNMINQVDQLPGLWRNNRYEFLIFIVTLAAILCLDLPIGLLIGVMFSLATVIFRTQAPKAYLLGRLPHTDIYRNIKKNKTAEQIPGLKIFKFEGSLYFASAENYRRTLYRQVGMNPKKIFTRAKSRAKKAGRARGDIDLKTNIGRSERIKQILDVVSEDGSQGASEARLMAQRPIHGVVRKVSFESVRSNVIKSVVYRSEIIPSTVNVFCIILDLSACAFTDSVGIRLLSQIVDEFNKIGVEIYLSGVTWIVRSQLRRANFYAKRSEDSLFVTVHDAVLHALSALYKELVEDENLQSQDLLSEDCSSIISRGTSLSRGTSGSELGRDRRRLIRIESWLQHGVSENPFAGDHPDHSILPAIAESQQDLASTPSAATARTEVSKEEEPQLAESEPPPQGNHPQLAVGVAAMKQPNLRSETCV